MRIRRHSRVSSLFRAINQRAAQFREFVPQLINRRPHIESQVGRNLFVATAPTMKLVSRLSNQSNELLFNKVMNVLRIVVVKKRLSLSRAPSNLLQPLKYADQLFGRQH